ncbi:MAG: tetratricopeptide repeat protein [Planctomycetia bacterium]|nr:tetratricopeptide repeat protein [Planctomycetia bacterium]
MLTIGLGPTSARADFDEAFAAFQTGNYAEALTATDVAVKQNYAEARWWRLRLECLTTLGRYAEGVEALELSRRHHYIDASLRVVGFEVMRQAGDPKKAEDSLVELMRVAVNSPWRFSSAEDRVWIGRAAALLGADARQVLESYYEPAQKLDAELRVAYLAIGELALAKRDLAVATENYRAALKRYPEDPDFMCGLARAVDEESEEESRKLVAQALERNAAHVPSLLFTAEEALAHEDFSGAAAALDKLASVNPQHAIGWALRAALCYLKADSFGTWYCREAALETWSDNPEVDHVLGEKLSRAYRFAEGAKYQRSALAIDAKYLPARTQLAQDLLRLGESDEGWRLVEEVQQADPYDVVAYNLATLKDRLKDYTTLDTKHFRLHMERREAAVYGPRVLELLERARITLGQKYGWMPARPVVVEILTRQQDFAIRTFGLPGGDGILGVCFGMVITANSPAALAGQTTNWEATLWHEYCHVVTLELTRHRLPRWLSEGISVYEERQADATWGNRLNRELRTMIVAGELTPLSKLNEAFRKPKSGEHFNLAYYEASLAIEYLVEKHGFATLRKILGDVGAGLPINEALVLRAGSLDALDKSFGEFALARAEAYGPKIDWSDEPMKTFPRGSAEGIAAWLKDHPQHYLGRMRYAQALIEAKRWDEAAKTLDALIADVPQWAGDGSPYSLLARVRREQGDVRAERTVLEASAATSDDALETYRRLIELALAAGDDGAVRTNVERYLAVQPLDEFPYRTAAEHAKGAGANSAGATRQAIAAARSLLALDPADRAGAHYLFASLLHARHDPEAKRQALLALEETPRYRDAQKLLLAIVAQETEAAQRNEKAKLDEPEKKPVSPLPKKPLTVEP